MFDAYFSDIFGILGKNKQTKKTRGFLTPKGKITKPAYYVS